MRKFIIAALLLFTTAYAGEVKLSHVVGDDDDGAIWDIHAGQFTLMTNTLAATDDSSLVTIQSGWVPCHGARDLLGYVHLMNVLDTGSVANDTVKAYLYTGYRDTTGLKWLLDSCIFAAAGIDYIVFDNDTILKDYLWFDIQAFTGVNLATDLANEDQTVLYQIKLGLTPR